MNGDIVCAPKDFPVLLEEFKQFCHKTAHKLFILNATDAFIEEYKIHEHKDLEIEKELNRISEEWLDGYMADVTRHEKDAPGGVMEYIIYEAFQVFKEEGIKYGSLGIAPLAGLFL